MEDQFSKAQKEAKRIGEIPLKYLYTRPEAEKDLGMTGLREHRNKRHKTVPPVFPQPVAIKGGVPLYDIRDLRLWKSKLPGPGRPRKK